MKSVIISDNFIVSTR